MVWRIERKQFDAADLEAALKMFLSASGLSVQVSGIEIDTDTPAMDVFCKLFSVFAMEGGDDCESPVEMIFNIAELRYRAIEAISSWDKNKSWFPAPERSIGRDREILNLLSLEYGAFLEDGDRQSIERYVRSSEMHHDRKGIDKEIEAAVEEHYKNRRAESLAVTSAPKLRALIMERDGAKCRWCGETEGLALDHILPVAAGGTDDPDNLQLLCGSCNSSKGDRVPSQFKEV